MKIKRVFKNLLFYILGLITVPLILMVVNYIFYNDINDANLNEKIDLYSFEGLRSGGEQIKYKIDADSALIIRDTQDLNAIRDIQEALIVDSLNLEIKTNPFTAGSVTSENWNKYSIGNKNFVGIDLNGFENNQQRFLRNVVVGTPAFSALSSTVDQEAYLELFRDFKPSGKCKKPSSTFDNKEYILEAEVQGTKLIIDSFEFGEYNYSNPGCFEQSSSGFKLNNVVPIKDLNEEIPFKLRLITNGKANNSFKIKLNLKSRNGKTLLKYPSNKEFLEGTITTLYGGEIINEKFNVIEISEAITK